MPVPEKSLSFWDVDPTAIDTVRDRAFGSVVLDGLPDTSLAVSRSFAHATANQLRTAQRVGAAILDMPIAAENEIGPDDLQLVVEDSYEYRQGGEEFIGLTGDMEIRTRHIHGDISVQPLDPTGKPKDAYLVCTKGIDSLTETVEHKAKWKDKWGDWHRFEFYRSTADQFPAWLLSHDDEFEVEVGLGTYDIRRGMTETAYRLMVAECLQQRKPLPFEPHGRGVGSPHFMPTLLTGEAVTMYPAQIPFDRGIKLRTAHTVSHKQDRPHSNQCPGYGDDELQVETSNIVYPDDDLSAFRFHPAVYIGADGKTIPNTLSQISARQQPTRYRDIRELAAHG